MDLSIANVVEVSVSEAPSGVGEYNTSNVSLFTSEPFDEDKFGDAGYKIYLEPTEVGVDFGTESRTYSMANKIFSQRPNPLAGQGYLVVIPTIAEVQTVLPSANPASGTYNLSLAGDPTPTPINWDDTAEQIQTKLRAVIGMESAVVVGNLSDPSYTVTFNGYLGNPPLLQVESNTLNGGITLDITQATAGETLGAAITRTKDLVQYFGIAATAVISQTDGLAAAAIVLPLNKIAFVGSRIANSIDPGEYLDLLRSGNFHNTRGLYYGSDNDADLLDYIAAYMGRALSVNFGGSNTTGTMQLKDLLGIQPDPTMTQTIYNKAKTAGADIYVSIQGVPKVMSFGANKFFDQEYNLRWFVGALQIAGFNYLATTSTKVPQTESGLDGLKGAYRTVCEQAVTNQYSAPGVWNSATTFGNQDLFLKNVEQRGYYIYSAPIASQSQADRIARIAPLVQIALKEAGAIHSSTIIVNINP